MRDAKFWQTQFFKLIVMFLVLGLLPILILLLVFYNWTSKTASGLLDEYYEKITISLEMNTEDLISSVDESVSGVYNYYDDRLGYLYDVLENDSYVERSNSILYMLYDIVMSNDNISAIRFVDAKGEIFTAYSDQGKTAIEGKELYNSIESNDPETNRNLFILPTEYQGYYCKNSNDYVFTIVRNYMNVRYIRAAREEILGTFYVDVDVDRIAEYAALTESNEQIYIADRNTGKLLYSSNPSDYDRTPTAVTEYLKNATDKNGLFRFNSEAVYYNTIGETDCVIFLGAEETIVSDHIFSNKMRTIFIIMIIIVVLVALYIAMSRQMSSPLRELSDAMEKVREGYLSVRANVKSTEETRILSEGFNSMVEELSEYIDRVYVAELKEREAELAALKMQIKPHYLYNTLDIIRMTATENEDNETAELLLSLSAQLHYLMDSRQEKVPLKDEIKNIEHYFVITRKRYMNKYGLSVDVPDRLMDVQVPKLILQPMVENAVKHGLREQEGSGNVTITATEEDGIIYIKVMDDGVGFDEETLKKVNGMLATGETEEGLDKVFGVGMKNVSDRIKFIYGEEYGYSITSARGMGTMITFRLPYEN